MVENVLLEVAKGFAVGFGSGYIGISTIKTGYDFFRRGERNLDRFTGKMFEKMLETDTMEKTVYVGAILTLGYIALDTILMK